MRRHHFLLHQAILPGLRGQCVRTVCQRVLIGPANTMTFGHLLGGVAHG